jgi:hypothetical protein
LVWKQTIWQPCILLADERARNGVLQTMIRRFNVEELHIRYIHQIYKYFAKIFLSWRFVFLTKKCFFSLFLNIFSSKFDKKIVSCIYSVNGFSSEFLILYFRTYLTFFFV